MKRHASMIWLASLLVPSRLRSEWKEEWHAELEFIRRTRPSEAIRFARGAFRDAAWLRRNSGFGPMDSPASCLAVLAGIFAVAAFVAFGFAGPRTLLSRIRIPLAYALLLQIGPAIVVLPSCARIALGDPLRRRAAAHLVLKLGLLVPLVFCTALIASWLIVPSGFGLVCMVGYLLAFRWALDDHRRRCPVCLYHLSMPTPLGNSSRVLLDWYGTELICTRGHGMLYVSEVPYTSWGANRWLGLGRIE